MLDNRIIEIDFYSNGKAFTVNNDFDINLQISFDLKTKQNASIIRIFNMSEQTANLIDKDTIIDIKVGYDFANLLYQGKVSNIGKEIAGLDTVIVIESSGFDVDLNQQTFVKSYGKGTPIRLILQDIFAKTGKKFSIPADINQQTKFIANGTINSVLDLLLKPYKLTAVLVNDTWYVSQIDKPLRNVNVPFINGDSGLVSDVKKKTADKKDYLTFSCLFNSGITIGNYAYVNDQLIKVVTILYSLNSRQGEFIQRVTGVAIGN